MGNYLTNRSPLAYEEERTAAGEGTTRFDSKWCFAFHDFAGSEGGIRKREGKRNGKEKYC